MDAKDYISIIALVISLVSLGTTIWTFHFNKSTKGTEMRAQLLLKIADSKNQAFNVQDYLARLARGAADKYPEAAKRIEGFANRMNALAVKSELIYKRIDALSSIEGLDMYHKIYHDVHDVCTQIIDLKTAAENEFGKFISGNSGDTYLKNNRDGSV